MVFNALDEVLFWDAIPLFKSFIQQTMKQYYPHDRQGFYQAKEKFFNQYIPTKEVFLSKLNHYSQKGSAVWVAGGNGYCDDMDKDSLVKAITVSSKRENGQRKAMQASKWLQSNPDFWGFYQKNIFHRSQNTVLELTVGAGGGTNAVMAKMSQTDYYMGVDIDFICAKNADAIAKYYQVNGLGLATSLWNLPFEDGSFTTVCCNAGLEECREVPTVLAQAVRVLSPKGRLVIRCLREEKSLWVSYFQKYGFSAEETTFWLNKVRLFSNVEQLKKQLSDNGLILIAQKDCERLGHIVVFEKV